MHRKTITVETKTEREGQKSRSFSVELLAYVLANDLWELGGGGKEKTNRPVLMAYAGTHQASRAFSANLRSGRPAAVAGSNSSTRFEIPKSAGFRFETFSREGATLTLASLPGLFGFQPLSADAGRIAFLCLPPTWWVDGEAQAISPVMGREEAREAAVAAYFVAYLDQRSPLPIANDLSFHLALYRAALQQPWCQQTSGAEWSPGRLFHVGLEAIGFEPALYCNVDPATFGEFLKAQTALHLPSEKENPDHGTTAIRRPRRLLPDPVHAAAPARVAG